MLLPSTFAALSLFTHKAITMAPMAEARTDEFYTSTLGPDEIIDPFHISCGRMKADVFICKLLLDPTCSQCAAN